jgi:hypothetical protein
MAFQMVPDRHSVMIVVHVKTVIQDRVGVASISMWLCRGSVALSSFVDGAWAPDVV